MLWLSNYGQFSDGSPVKVYCLAIDGPNVLNVLDAFRDAKYSSFKTLGTKHNIGVLRLANASGATNMKWELVLITSKCVDPLNLAHQSFIFNLSSSKGSFIRPL